MESSNSSPDSLFLTMASIGGFLLLLFLIRKTTHFVYTKPTFISLALYSLFDQIYNICRTALIVTAVFLFLFLLRNNNIIAWALCVAVVGVFFYALFDSYKSYNITLNEIKRSRVYIIAEALVSIVLCVPIYFAAVSVLNIRFSDFDWLILVKHAVLLILLLSVAINAVIAVHKYKTCMPVIQVIMIDPAK